MVSTKSKDPLPRLRRAGPSLCAATLALAIACGGDASTANRDATYTAVLLGSNERPGSTRSTATGAATMSVAGGTATFTVTATGFATALTAGHLHIGGAGDIGPVVVPFPMKAQSGEVASGTIDLTVPITFNTLTISADSLRALFTAGTAYVNLHTAAWPDGEIRGQLLRER